MIYIFINDIYVYVLSLDGNERMDAIWVLEFYGVYGGFGGVLLCVFVDMCFVLNYFKFAFQMFDKIFIISF